MSTSTKPQIEKLETTDPLVERYAVNLNIEASAEGISQFMTPETINPFAPVAEKIFTVNEVSTILAVPTANCYHLIQSGQLKAIRNAGRRPGVFVRETTLRKFMAKPSSIALYRGCDFSRVK